MVYLFQNEIPVPTHDFPHLTKNCQTQFSLRRVENHAVEMKDGKKEMKCQIDAEQHFACVE